MQWAKQIWTKYLKWVSLNPKLATDAETCLKWISYIATGKTKMLWHSLLSATNIVRHGNRPQNYIDLFRH